MLYLAILVPSGYQFKAASDPLSYPIILGMGPQVLMFQTPELPFCNQKEYFAFKWRMIRLGSCK